MNLEEQKAIFLRIVKASSQNIVVFGLGFIVILFVYQYLELVKLALALTIFDVFFTGASLTAFVFFLYQTLRSIQPTMESKPEELNFKDIYAYTLAGSAVRLIELTVCIIFVLYLFNTVFIPGTNSL